MRIQIGKSHIQLLNDLKGFRNLSGCFVGLFLQDVVSEYISLVSIPFDSPFIKATLGPSDALRGAELGMKCLDSLLIAFNEVFCQDCNAA